MTSLPDLLIRIRETEESKLSGFTLFFNSVTIAPTAHYVSTALVKEKTDEIMFRANLVAPVFVIIFMCLFTFTIVADVITHPSATNIAGTIALAFIHLFVWSIWLGPQRNYTIILNREEITAGGKTFKWTEIKDTAILHLPKGKQGTDYLVIILQDETYYKFNLGFFFSFSGFATKLSSYVEYFRPT